jgi:A/G-specific adenine glycosylase
VLVSELMLQQTQVDRVVPRFEAFIRAFPDLQSLAAASEDEVLAAWSGLGYYRRARLLWRLAREVAAGPGELPVSADELVELPGIGPYTAAAVASLAFGEAVPVLDGNVARVASRVLASTGDPRSAAGRAMLLGWLGPLVQAGPPGLVNEALMELGATVCRPTSPDCTSCPLAMACRARAEGRPERYPVPRPRRASVDLVWAAACCIDSGGRWLVRRVASGPILIGLWLPPIGPVEEGERPEDVARRLIEATPSAPVELLPPVRHSITHRRITVHPVRLRMVPAPVPADGDRWVDPARDAIATSSLFVKILAVNEL